MESDLFVGAAQQALWVLALASLPILLPALIAGIVIGMLQAATSINDTALNFVPKLFVVGVCLLLFGSSIALLLIDFTHDVFARLPEIAR